MGILPTVNEDGKEHESPMTTAYEDAVTLMEESTVSMPELLSQEKTVKQ